MKLIRMGYGKKDTPEDMREYKIDGRGPVGTLDEFKKYFPDEEFEIIDSISKENLFETKKTTQLTLKQLE